MECNKSSAQREIHSSKYLHLKRRYEINNVTLHLSSEKNKSKLNPKLAKGKNNKDQNKQNREQ